MFYRPSINPTVFSYKNNRSKCRTAVLHLCYYRNWYWRIHQHLSLVSFRNVTFIFDNFRIIQHFGWDPVPNKHGRATVRVVTTRQLWTRTSCTSTSFPRLSQSAVLGWTTVSNSYQTSLLGDTGQMDTPWLTWNPQHAIWRATLTFCLTTI